MAKVIAVVGAIAFLLGFAIRGVVAPLQNTPPISTPPVEFSNGVYHVTRVLDGDTIDLTNGTRIRYEGIDAPEKNAADGLSAWEDNKRLVEDKDIRIEVAASKKDNFDRILAYVWVDDVFVNQRLIEDGHAKVYVYFKTMPPKYLSQFQAAENSAKQNGWGMWASY